MAEFTKMNQGSGTSSGHSMRIQDLLAANPYRNLSYTVSPWQKFLSSLGFRTSADAWKENMAVQANEYDAAILQKEADESYNSPQQQMARMTAAGLNPELNGGQSIDSGSAASMGEDPSTPMQSTADDNPLLATANLIMSSVSSAFGMVKDVMTIRNMHLTNETGEIENGRRVAEFAKWITGQMHEVQSPVGDYGDYRQSLADSADDMFKTHRSFIPKKFQKQFKKNLTTFFMSLDYKADSYAKKKQVNADMKDVALQTFSRYFGGVDFTAWKETTDTLVKLSDLQDKSNLEKNISDNYKSISLNAYESSVLEGLNPQSEALRRNNENALGAQNAALEHEMQSVLSKYIHKLKGLADKGDPLAWTILMNLSFNKLNNGSGLEKLAGVASKILQ